MQVIKGLLAATTALTLGTIAAQAGGIERNAFNPGFMYEKGNWVELSFGMVSPSVSGILPVGPGIPSGDMAKSYNVFSGVMKTQVTEDFALGLIVDEPVGVDVSYPASGYPFAGSTATVTATQITVMGLYRFSENVSAFGGLRAQKAEGTALVTPLPPAPYSMTTQSDTAFGYVLGVAYERPEIALRVALSYVSELTHDFKATDNLPLPGAADFSSTIPQSINLDFQTGVAANTLVFGSIRWRDWSEFEIRPRGSVPLSVDNKDTITYSLGVGRKFTDSISGALSIAHEPKVGGVAGNLGPTDGYTSVSLAGIFTMQQGMKITVGGSYGWIGDAATDVNGPALGGTTSFSDNHYTAVGVKVGWNF